jgi:hypothetical protein
MAAHYAIWFRAKRRAFSAAFRAWGARPQETPLFDRPTRPSRSLAEEDVDHLMVEVLVDDTRRGFHWSRVFSGECQAAKPAGGAQL